MGQDFQGRWGYKFKYGKVKEVRKYGVCLGQRAPAKWDSEGYTTLLRNGKPRSGYHEGQGKRGDGSVGSGPEASSEDEGTLEDEDSDTDMEMQSLEARRQSWDGGEGEGEEGSGDEGDNGEDEEI